MKFKSLKLQAAIDFLSTYGLAIAIMLIAFIAIYRIALAPNNPAVYCTASPGFNCNFISINSMGVLTAKFSQAIGTSIKINGVACSSQQSSSTDTPAYGNLFVSNTIPGNYPTTPAFPPGNTMYSGGYYIFYVYCYSSAGIATSLTGQPFSGYVWLNYTIPNYGMETQKIATFSTIYS